MFTKVKHFCALYLRVFPHCIAPAAFSACLCSAPVHPKPQLLASSVIFPNLLQPPPPAGPGAGGRPRGPFCRRRGWRSAGSREMAAVRCRPRAGSGLMAVGSVSPTCAVLYVPDPLCARPTVSHTELEAWILVYVSPLLAASHSPPPHQSSPSHLMSLLQKQQSPMPLNPAGRGVLLKPILRKVCGSCSFWDAFPSMGASQALRAQPPQTTPFCCLQQFDY